MMSLGAHIPRYLAYEVSKVYGFPESEDTAGQQSDMRSGPEVTASGSVLKESNNKSMKLPKDAAQYLAWMGTTTYGCLTGFNAQSAAVASVGLGVEAPEVQAARSLLYKDTLGWIYNLPREKREEVASLLGTTLDDDPSDAEVFLYMMKLYNEEDEAGNQSNMPPASAEIWGQHSDRSRIAASIRELANVYRFTPGMIAHILPKQWLPIDIFERDVELGWFLVRHAGDAVSLIPSSDWEEIAYKVRVFELIFGVYPSNF
jgi:hypothetical protein